METYIRVRAAIGIAIQFAHANAKLTGKETRWMVVVAENEAIRGSVFPHGRVVVDDAAIERLDIS